MKIQFVLDRIEGNSAIIITPENVEVSWPKNLLPSGVKEGDVVSFAINEQEEETRELKRDAKDLLNEILNPD